VERTTVAAVFDRKDVKTQRAGSLEKRRVGQTRRPVEWRVRCRSYIDRPSSLLVARYRLVHSQTTDASLRALQSNCMDARAHARDSPRTIWSPDLNHVQHHRATDSLVLPVLDRVVLTLSVQRSSKKMTDTCKVEQISRHGEPREPPSWNHQSSDHECMEDGRKAALTSFVRRR